MAREWQHILFMVLLTISGIAQAHSQSPQLPSSAPLHGEEVYMRSTLKSLTPSQEIFTIRGENDLWVVEAFRINIDGWQDRIWRRSFVTLTEARQIMQQIGATYHGSSLNQPTGWELKTSLNTPPLWKVTQEWSWQWEQKYADWVNENIDPEFFRTHQIATDCADVAYALRWIFARINGLPAAGLLAASGNLLTHNSVRPEWLRLPTSANWNEDKRFRAALNYLMDNTYTHTLLRDSYPVEISQMSLLAGTHYLKLFKTTGHTQFVHRTSYENPASLPVKVIASTVPRSVRSLYEEYFWEWSQPKETEGGFMRFRWPIVSKSGTTLVPREKMPFFSRVQYAPDFQNGQPSYSMAVIYKLNPRFDAQEVLKAGYSDLRAQLKQRQIVVVEGAKVCSIKSCEPGTDEYENWSTPSRDKRIGQLIMQLDAFIFQIVDPALHTAREKELDSTAIELDSKSYPLRSVLFVWKSQLYSSEPTVSQALRWGLEPTAFLESLQARFSSTLKTREQKILSQGNACQNQPCTTDTDVWMKWQTTEEDNRLSALADTHALYCKNFPETDCQIYQTLVTQAPPVSANGKSDSLLNWFDATPWLNADPNQPPRIRWGGIRENIKWKMFDSSSRFVVSRAGWIWEAPSQSPSHKPLVNIDSNIELPPAPGFQWLALNSSGTRALSLNPNEKQLHLVDLTPTSIGPSQELDISAWPSNTVERATFLTDTVAVISLSNTGTESTSAQLVDLSSQPRLLASLSDVAGVIPTKRPGISVIQHRNLSHTLIDVRSTPHVVPIPLETSSTDITPLVIKSETDQYWLLNRCRHANDCSTYSLSKATHEFKAQPQINNLVAITSKSYHAFVRGNEIFRLLSLDKNLNVVSEATLGTDLRIKSPWACWETSNKQTCSRFTQETLDLKLIEKNDTWIDWDETFVIRTTSQSARPQVARWSQIEQTLQSASWLNIASGVQSGWLSGFHHAGEGRGLYFIMNLNQPQLGSVLTTPYSYITLDTPEGQRIERGVSIGFGYSKVIWLEL